MCMRVLFLPDHPVMLHHLLQIWRRQAACQELMLGVIPTMTLRRVRYLLRCVARQIVGTFRQAWPGDIVVVHVGIILDDIQRNVER